MGSIKHPPEFFSASKKIVYQKNPAHHGAVPLPPRKAPPSTPMNAQEVAPVDLSAAMDPSKAVGLN